MLQSRFFLTPYRPLLLATHLWSIENKIRNIVGLGCPSSFCVSQSLTFVGQSGNSATSPVLKPILMEKNVKLHMPTDSIQKRISFELLAARFLNVCRNGSMIIYEIFYALRFMYWNGWCGLWASKKLQLVGIMVNRMSAITLDLDGRFFHPGQEFFMHCLVRPSKALNICVRIFQEDMR